MPQNSDSVAISEVATDEIEDKYLFYCDICQSEKNWIQSEYIAEFVCEICGTETDCNIVPLFSNCNLKKDLGLK